MAKGGRTSAETFAVLAGLRKQECALGMNRSSHIPRILYVSEGWTHGAQVRCLNILRALQQIGTVEVVLLNNANTNADAIVEVGREAKIAYTLQNERRPTNSIMAKVKSTFN